MSRPEPVEELILALPAYNEAAGIGDLLTRAADVLSGEGLPWRILVVDDGSTDGTARLVTEFAAERPGIELLRHDANRGLGPAILTGLKRALLLTEGRVALVITMDADLTHPPETIPLMRRAADAGADVVIASRYQPGSRVIGLSRPRRFLSSAARRVFGLLLPMPGVEDYTCGFRAVRSSWLRRAWEHYGPEGLITRRGFACTDELLVKLFLLGPVIQEVPFMLRYDLKRGRSKIRLATTTLETLRLIHWARRQRRRR